MCGILGIAINDWSLDTLQTLYNVFDNQSSRGTDGAGVSINSKNLWRFRSYDPHRIFAAYNMTMWNSVKVGDRIMFHHRYPTSTKNAPKFNHPIQSEDGRIHMIHNGIITNADELYEELKAHKFETEDGNRFTDSEVIVHLFEDELEHTNDVFTALKKTSEKLQGSYAVAIQMKGDKNIYLIAQNNPIVISKDLAGNWYFSSEAYKGLEKVYQLSDGEIVSLSVSGYKILGKFKGKDYSYKWTDKSYDYDLDWKSKWNWKQGGIYDGQ